MAEAKMEPRGKKYSAPDIDVYYEPRLCIHAHRCVDGAPAVFDPNARPWIQPANATADQLAAVVERCPTGALHFVRKDGGAAEEPVDGDSISLVTNGPLYVRGDVTLVLQNGTAVRHDTRVALCRCGHSQNKPFCDNSHKTAGFVAE
jgi:uncharacterized Fe-S cluster protein YjdI